MQKVADSVSGTDDSVHSVQLEDSVFKIISFMYWAPLICGLRCDSEVDRSKIKSSKAGLGMEMVVDKLSCGHTDLEISCFFPFPTLFLIF